MDSFGDLISSFKTQPKPASPVPVVVTPRTPQVNPRENTPASQVRDGASEANVSKSLFDGPGAVFENAISMESMDLDEDTGMGMLSAMMGARDDGPGHSREDYQSWARTRGRKYGLTIVQFEELMDFCELSPVKMLIDVKTHQFRIENDLLKRFMRIFIRHADFLIRLRHAVAAALLAPNIPAYVDGVTAQLTRYLEDNAEGLLGIPDAQKSDPADWALVKSAIAIELTNMRSTMKLKIDSSIKNKADIYDLTTSLMMYGMRAKKEHWGRFAFLRQCTLIYDRMTPTARKRIDYWKHIDKCLLDMRQSARQDYPRPEDAVARKKNETLFIAHLLECDIKDFTLKSGALARTIYPNDQLTELQYSTEKLVGGFLVNDNLGPVTTEGAQGDPVEAVPAGGSESQAAE
ncbi:hypothetical protein TRAPUB_2101 [Trametes pubescens]|uniref:Uncharacterized protein n=1 Tax=Trametes pubescens TaxID=154538 RepID=A0A1M2VHL2_TRAPU|nr:hypothetical protein TRAPUB_2101 [Trametes pubescens]